MDSRKERDEAKRQELAVPGDDYGRPIDPADGYKEFLYGLYYLIADAGDAGYSPHGLAKLKEARLRFIEEFEARHPERAEGQPPLGR